MKNVSSTRAGKKGGGQPGLKLQKNYIGQGVRDKQFPYPKCPKTGVLLRVLVLGMIGLDEVGKQLFFFFFSRRVGCIFFWGGEYLCHSPAIRCRASWRIAKQHIFLGTNIRRLIRICQKQLMWFSSHQAVSLKDVGSFNFLLAARCSSWYLYVWCIYDVYTYIYICIYSIYIYLIDKCLYTDNLSQGCRWSEVL